jgi:hypothetical protein
MSKEHDPLKIQEKIDAGLTREQAIEVLDRQAAHSPIAVKERKNSRSASGSSGTLGASAGGK